MLQEQLTTNNSKLIPEAVQFAFWDSASFARREEFKEDGGSATGGTTLFAVSLAARSSAPGGFLQRLARWYLIAMLYQHHKT